MILGVIAVIIAIVAAVVVAGAVLHSALKESRKDADKNFSDKPVGSTKEGCPLADLTVTVVRPGKTGNPNFSNTIQLACPSPGSGSAKCDEAKTFAKRKPGKYNVTVKPTPGNGYSSPASVSVSLAQGEKKKITVELIPYELVKVTPTKDVKQFINLPADAKDPTAGRKLKVEAHINKKEKDVPIYFDFKPGAKNDTKLTDPVKTEITKSAKTNAEGVATAEFTLSRYGGDEFNVLASLSPDVKQDNVSKKESAKIVVWRRLWYQLNHHKDVTPPSMATSVSKFKKVFIDFTPETPVKHTLTAKGKVIVGSHNAATYHALRKSAHPARSVHVILCDQQIDAPAGLTNEVEVEFKKAKDYIEATKHADPRIMFNPPLQSGAKLFISGSWRNASTGKSGTLTDDATKTTKSIGLAKYNNKDFMEINLPADAAPTAAKPVKVKIKVTVASGPWGGDGGTAPHNLIVIDSNDTIHTMCVMHELGHLINMGPMSYSVNCPPGFTYADHTKMYQSNGAHCWSGGSLSGGKGKDGTCIMYHQLNTKCTLAFCADCTPFVRAQKLESFNDLKK